ncbi:MAG: SDR family oxidoreductase [candidate division Zixibacteria bacterium]|nr:SDR family oxidoreductase [candidate division Zixibacteria bacterium]
MSFTGKSVLVTGGARGIGLAIVEKFASSGATVSILDLEPFDGAGQSWAGRVTCITGSVARQADVARFVADVMKRVGRIDIVVNNAGIVRDNVIWKMPEEDFDAVISVNLKGPWLLCKEVAPILRAQGEGRIINIVSRAWHGAVGQSNYSSSKGGLVSLTRVLALEMARFNVTVNAVAPGLIDTPMTQAMPKEALDRLIAAQPGGKMGTPEDVAGAVAFLASDSAKFITGQIIYVDGGKSIGAGIS